jgi:hypothetical protein
MQKAGRVRKDKAKIMDNLNGQLVESAQWTMETICALFLTSATSTTATTLWPGSGIDSVALASASHTTLKAPTSTYSNLTTSAAMSPLVLQEMITLLSSAPTDEGRPQGDVGELLLIHGRYWDWRVKEIFGTEKQVDSANNNVNTINLGPKITPVCVPYLGDSFKGFALVAKKSHSLTRFEAKKPTLKQDIDIATGAYIQRSMFRFGIDHLSPRSFAFNAGGS